jgi:hypothetical protein
MNNLKKLPNLFITSVAATALLASCAGPENYQQKMARYSPKTEGRNQVPEIKTYDFKFAQTNVKSNVKKGRGPASASDKIETDKGMESNTTNKKLYFLSLYTQYENLKSYSTEFVGPSVSICPNFHTSLLRHYEVTPVKNATTVGDKKFTYDTKKFSDEAYVASNPELLLPLSKEEATPKVIDIIRGSKESFTDFAINEMVHKALDIHLAKTYSEIRELCEYGVSDNYYIYENLITHIKNNKFEADSSNMNTLLKTTVFSNVALMTSLEKQVKARTHTTGRSIASVDGSEKRGPYIGEIMARLNVTWANQYFDFISEK